MQNILIALKWRQTFEERFLNRKYVSGRWDVNVHPNVHINMPMFISYKVHLQSVTFNLPQIGALIKCNLGRLCSSPKLELLSNFAAEFLIETRTVTFKKA